MSRIGNAPITVPKGVTITQSGRTLSAKGPKGNMSFEIPVGVTLENKDGTLRYKRDNDSQKVRALHGMARLHAALAATGETGERSLLSASCGSGRMSVRREHEIATALWDCARAQRRSGMSAA